MKDAMIINEDVAIKQISLYDDKRSCELCSSTFVRRRVDDLARHAQRHAAVGQQVVERDGGYFIQTGSHV